jgi:hypothetical protein
VARDDIGFRCVLYSWTLGWVMCMHCACKLVDVIIHALICRPRARGNFTDSGVLPVLGATVPFSRPTSSRYAPCALPTPRRRPWHGRAIALRHGVRPRGTRSAASLWRATVGGAGVERPSPALVHVRGGGVMSEGFCPWT